MPAVVHKPIRRSRLRRTLGKRFYTLRRYLYWLTSRKKFATRKGDFLPWEVFTHQSLLLRRLSNVDMWMQRNKITNLRLALNRINGIILDPGEIFSFWYLVGRPGSTRGFLPGMVLEDGHVRAGIGGGLCQLSNLIFWMTLHTPLDVLERHRHSYDVFPDSNRTLPFGSGATVSWNYVDLQIQNNTENRYQLVLSLDDTYLYGQWRSDTKPEFHYRVVERDHLIQGEYWGGFTRRNTLYRITYDADSDRELREDFLMENHAIMMYNPLIEGKPT